VKSSNGTIVDAECESGQPPTQPSLRGLQKKSYLRVQFRLIELKFMLTNMIIDLLF